VVGGYVQGIDDMSKIPAFYDLLDEAWVQRNYWRTFPTNNGNTAKAMT